MSRGGGGEILRVTWVSKKHQIPIALSTISIVYERIVEIVPVMFLLLLGITYFAAQVLSIAALFMLFILLIWLKWEEFIRISVKILKIQLTQEELLKISELKRKPSLNILAVGLSSMVWILDIARLKLIALAFGWDPNIGLLALISLANLLFGLMAFTPGGGGHSGGRTLRHAHIFWDPLHTRHLSDPDRALYFLCPEHHSGFSRVNRFGRGG